MDTIHRSARARCAVVGVASFVVFASASARAETIETPQFRKGLWSFERTLERIREAPHLNQLLVHETVTRCVDPSLAMKHIFASPSIGNCNSSRPELVDNRYIFSKRCDFMGPVRTEIIVESDESYTELNVLTVGNFPRQDMVIAKRIGDCDTAAGYAPSTTSDGFQLSSSRSRPVRQ
ncbi:MAG: DUF3617 domain-containing protein [Xanthobacteraceae bacterium]|nr:DUF3617 domain-containing protein [Xanthobacteraceae bacterium]